MQNKPVLDPCCGGKMFWFDKADPRVVFGDIRRETHHLSNRQTLIVEPDEIMDFRALPFPDASFAMVVFDPPHLLRLGKTSWLRKKYGGLLPAWEHDIAQGFSECFRVLRPGGTLVFKWNESSIPVKDILALTPEKPLFGNKYGKQEKSHWVVFMKGGEA